MGRNRLRLVFGCFVALGLVAACGGDTGSTLPPATVVTTTTAAATTTVPATTTAAPTTTLPSTTTTAAATTTTGVVPDTDALVATGFGVLGWFDHAAGAWVPWPEPDAMPEVEGAIFDVVTLQPGAATVEGSGMSVCEITGNLSVEFDPPLPVRLGEPGAVAVLGATWDLVPRPVTISDAPGDRLQTALDHLAANGIDDTAPPFVQHVEADLDGDGAAEGVLVVERLGDDRLGGPGDYSLTMVFGDGSSAVVAESYGVADNPYVLAHVVSAVADLDGDGVMEVVADNRYYEGTGSVAWEYAPGPALTEALAGGCGA